jgi:hypothetical protein
MQLRGRRAHVSPLPFTLSSTHKLSGSTTAEVGVCYAQTLISGGPADTSMRNFGCAADCTTA